MTQQPLLKRVSLDLPNIIAHQTIIKIFPQLFGETWRGCRACCGPPAIAPERNRTWRDRRRARGPAPSRRRMLETQPRELRMPVSDKSPMVRINNPANALIYGLSRGDLTQCVLYE
jgi:hypothetical protein